MWQSLREYSSWGHRLRGLQAFSCPGHTRFSQGRWKKILKKVFFMVPWTGRKTQTLWKLHLNPAILSSQWNKILNFLGEGKPNLLPGRHWRKITSAGGKQQTKLNCQCRILYAVTILLNRRRNSDFLRPTQNEGIYS